MGKTRGHGSRRGGYRGRGRGRGGGGGGDSDEDEVEPQRGLGEVSSCMACNCMKAGIVFMREMRYLVSVMVITLTAVSLWQAGRTLQ